MATATRKGSESSCRWQASINDDARAGTAQSCMDRSFGDPKGCEVRETEAECAGRDPKAPQDARHGRRAPAMDGERQHGSVRSPPGGIKVSHLDTAAKVLPATLKPMRSRVSIQALNT